MEGISTLKDIVEFNSDFKSAVNIYLNLNDPKRILGYIPTSSSINLMVEYLDLFLNNKEQANVLIGPYGKGKSHFLLVLLAILSMERNDENGEIISRLADNISNIDNSAKSSIYKIWEGKRYLPVLINNVSNDLSQSFLMGLHEALKRNGLIDIAPNTYYSVALDRINDWKYKYEDTYKNFVTEVINCGWKPADVINGLKTYSRQALDLFIALHPKVTSGSEFNPMVNIDILPLYKSVAEKLIVDSDYDGIYIVFDEFSKFIENQSDNVMGSNMKLIQDVCELCINCSKPKIFLTLVTHKTIKEYDKYLSRETINAFTGIEGRLTEKYFVKSNKNNYELVRHAINKKVNDLKLTPLMNRYLQEETIDRYWNIPAFKSTFVKNEFKDIVYEGCWPLNPITSYLALKISDKIGQNERTLFTFIANDEPYSVARYVIDHDATKPWIIGADLVFDYFSSIFKKDVVNEYVHNIWLSACYSLGKCTSNDQQKIIKALAVILIVNNPDEIPASANILDLSVETEDFKRALEQLETNQLIAKKRLDETFTFRTRAGSELRNEIRKRKAICENKINYSQILSEISGNYFVVPNRYNADNNITRYFENEYMTLNDFINIKNINAIIDDCSIDGKVITLYDFTSIDQEEAKSHFLDFSDERLIVICPSVNLDDKECFKEYFALREVQNDDSFLNDNEILRNEIPLLLEDLTVEIENIVNNIYNDSSGTKCYSFYKEKLLESDASMVEEVVGMVCGDLYKYSPEINNELVNRKSINSSQTRKSREKIIERILTHKDFSDYETGTSQEATIFRSLFVMTHILEQIASDNVGQIIHTINLFVDEACNKKSEISALIEMLQSRPYGMRLGVIPFYFAYVIASRNEDIVFYYQEREIEISAKIVIDMCEKPARYNIYVSRETREKEKYIDNLCRLFNVDDGKNLTSSRINNIVISMQRWYRSLPQVSRNDISIDANENSDIEFEYIATFKREISRIDYNPFEMLFVDLPSAFESKKLSFTFEQIEKCKRFLDDYYDFILEQVELEICDLWCVNSDEDLFHTLKNWYSNQSRNSQLGLNEGKMTNFMTCIETLNVYSDEDVAERVVKAITGVYLENWNNNSLDDFRANLSSVKSGVESINDNFSKDSYELRFTSRNGDIIKKMYSIVDENTGCILRNIIDDALDEFSDLSVNDRVSILLEMIEKTIK